MGPEQTNAAKLQAAFALHQQDQQGQAAALYEEILQSEPQHIHALQLLATIALQQNNPELAVELFDRVLQIISNDAGVFYNRGNALMDLKRPEEALSSYDRALKIKPDHVQALYNRGNALLGLKRHEDALDSYERVLKITPNDVEANWNESLCGLSMGDFELGWKKIRMALADRREDQCYASVCPATVAGAKNAAGSDPSLATVG